MTLRELGWNDRLSAGVRAARRDGLAAARVSLEHTHIYRVLDEAGEWLARVSGRLRHHAAHARRVPGGRRLGRGRAAAGRRYRAHPGGAAAGEPVLAPRRRATAPRSRSSPPTSTSCSSSPGSTATSIRGASSATSSSPADSGATPVDRPEQGGPRRRILAIIVDDVRAIAPGCRRPRRVLHRAGVAGARCVRTSATAEPARCSDRPAWASPRSSTGSSATTCWRRATFASPTAAGRHTSTSRQLVMLPGARHPDRHAGHARDAAVGNRRGRQPARSRTSPSSRRTAAASGTAPTSQSPAARWPTAVQAGNCPRPARRATASCGSSRRTSTGCRISARRSRQKRRARMLTQALPEAPQGQGGTDARRARGPGPESGVR